MIAPLLFVGLGLAAIVAFAMSGGDTPPEHQPDLPQPPPPSVDAVSGGKLPNTRWKLVNAILSDLQKAAVEASVPLGLLVGWIAKESGGKLGETTKYDERGYFQLMPDESRELGLDHKRLSSDPTYSIRGGLLLIGKYMKSVDGYGIAARGSSYFWRLVKLAHSMGSGAVKKIVDEAKAAGQAGSWDMLKRYAIDNNDHFLSLTKHSPRKWFPFVNEVYAVGKPYGFGGDETAVAGWFGRSYPKRPLAYTDIPDPLDVVKRA